ncbi:MAG: hypothetical protein NTW46_02845 [Candidatus Nealsonbacteria bacterium]|nr:hypothetical protein [Candidatus Nealsonbacteria bacterium]
MPEDTKKLVIFDGNALVHRAYHALPPLKSKSGELTNAVYGFLLVFLKAIKDFHPEYIAATFDLPAPSFRHIEYKLYKANRVKAPDELYEQIPKIKDILRDFNVKIFEKEGFEADDLIGTISKTAEKKQIYPKIETIIVSGDADVLQLVDDKTKAYILRKGVKDIVLYDEEKVKEKYGGLLPGQLVDYKALRGDPSDNIPGVFGIGEKTAIDLIKKFGTLESIYDELKKNSEKIKEIKEAVRKKLSDYKEQAFVSKMLAEIKKDVDMDFDLKDCVWGDYDKNKVIEDFTRYSFNSLIVRLNGSAGPEDRDGEKQVKANLKLW